MKVIHLSVLIFFNIILSILSISHADEYHVKNSQELQSALSLSSMNNINATIYLDIGIYNGNFRYLPSKDNYSITITTENEVELGDTILDGEEKSRVLYAESPDKTINYVIKNIVFQNGKLNNNTNNGTGLYIDTLGKIHISNCSFNNNVSNGDSARGGGAYLKSDNSILLENSNFIDNSVYINYTNDGCFGGGVYITSVHAVIRNNRINNNVLYANGSAFGSQTLSSKGAGMYIETSDSISLTNNLIQNNASNCSTSSYLQPNSSGGGLFITSNNVSIEKNNFSNNSTVSKSNGYVNDKKAFGGGIYCSAEIIRINKNIITNNNSSSGGGLYFSQSDQIVLSNNQISYNTATLYGGGIFENSYGTTIIQNNLIYKNLSDSEGGGIYSIPKNQLYYINNSIVYNSCKSHGAGIYFKINGTNELLNIYNNIVWYNNTVDNSNEDILIDGYGALKKSYNNNISSISGLWDISIDNVDGEPLFVDPNEDNYILFSTSPCVDSGSNDAPYLPETDINNSYRIQNENVNIGAYESVELAQPVPKFTANPINGIAPISVSFTNTSTGIYDSIVWDFGDNIKSTETNITHIFENPGIFSITLTVIANGKAYTTVKENFVNALFPSITGKILFSLNESTIIPLSNSLLSLEDTNYTCITDRLGNFSFNNIPPSNYNIVSEHEQFVNYEKTVEVVNGKNTLTEPIILSATCLNIYDNLAMEFLSLSNNYDFLSDNYDSLSHNYITNLNECLLTQSNFNELSINHSGLSRIYDKLSKSYDNLSITYYLITDKYNNLTSTYTDLIVKYENLNQNNSILESEYATLSNTYNFLSNSYNSLTHLYSENLNQNSICISNYNDLSINHLNLIDNYETAFSLYNELSITYDAMAQNYNSLSNNYISIIKDNEELKAIRDSFDIYLDGRKGLEEAIDSLKSISDIP